MSLRSNGSYIGPRPAGPSSSVASGIWDLRTAERQRRAAAWPIAGADPDFSSVALLLHMDGSGATFTDSSGTPKTVTANGNATQSTTQSKFGGKSAYFDGSGDYLSVTYSASLLPSGAANYTMEAWVYPDSSQPANGGGLFSTRLAPVYSNYEMSLKSNLKINLLIRRGDGTNSWGGYTSESATTLTANQWTHLALVSDAGDVTLYVNGVADATIVGKTVGAGWHSGGTPTLYIGSGGDGAYKGYIDDVRFTSVARYTANFTPPTLAFPDE